MGAEHHSTAEDAVRALAAAVGAARLYPPTSALPREAVARFVAAASTASSGASGPIRYVIDPHAVRIGDREISSGQGHVSAFAESLYAMQVGQLIFAPGITAEETAAFIEVVNRDAREIRDEEGIRHVLGAAEVSRIAVIEVTLRASEEEGLLGLDLTASPLEDIGAETVAAAERWAQQAREGTAHDDVAEAIGRLEEATREVASKRISDALMRLDERSRMRVLALALQADTSGQRMTGALDIIARMKPAALARLLTIVAMQAGTEPQRIAAAIDLPPELAQEVAMLLAPSPRSEEASGVPQDANVDEVAAGMAQETDGSDLRRQLAVSSPSLASGKALGTTVTISRAHPTVEAVEAIGEALPKAARDGAFASTREALRRLDELAKDPALGLAVEQAQRSIHDPEVLADVCSAPLTDADAAIAGEILMASGIAGAEAIITCFAHADAARKSLLRPVLRGMSDSLITAALRIVRSEDAGKAIVVLGLLPTLSDRRAIAVIVKALENLDASVRHAAVDALSGIPGDEGQAALAKALSHWDPETRRHVVSEIGRIRATVAIPALVRILEDIGLFERNHELKKEVIKSLESIGSSDALPVLRRLARRRLMFGQKNKELRFLARKAVERLALATTSKER